MRYDDFPPILCEEIVRVRRRLTRAGVPEKVTDRNLLIATWNVRALGDVFDAYDENPDSPKRNLRGLAVIAEIVRRFDVVAVQEVKSQMGAIRRLLDFLGPGWDVIVSDVTRGSLGNAERLAFLYDRRRVEPSGLAGELVIPPLESGDASRQFARTPYAVSFRAAREEFVLLTCHVLYGNVPADREPELREIARWMADWGTDANRFHNDLFLLGDFNIDRVGDPRFEAFASTGLNVPPPIRGVRTNVAGNAARHYDQIAWFMGQTDMEFTGRAGLVDFGDAVFRELTRSQMSWRVSDHLPLWAEFSIDRSNSTLADTLGIAPGAPDPLAGVPD